MEGGLSPVEAPARTRRTSLFHFPGRKYQVKNVLALEEGQQYCKGEWTESLGGKTSMEI